jgi:hypothetical protein
MSELPTPFGSIRIVPTRGSWEAGFIFIGTSDDPRKFQHSSDRGSSRVEIYFHQNFRHPIETSDKTLTPIYTRWTAPSKP